MIFIVAKFLIKPEHADKWPDLSREFTEATRAEPGNLRWDIWQDQADANRFVLDELYVDKAAVAAHRETPHFKNYLAQINNLADRTAIVSDAVEVA